MSRLVTRPRLAMGLGVTGILLMGIDLLITRSLFVHVAELMVASLLCLVLAIVVDCGGRPAAGPEGRKARKKV